MEIPLLGMRKIVIGSRCPSLGHHTATAQARGGVSRARNVADESMDKTKSNTRRSTCVSLTFAPRDLVLSPSCATAANRLVIGVEGLLPRVLYRYEVSLDRVLHLTSDETLGSFILPTFGDFSLVEVQPVAVQQWVADLNAAGYAPATIRKAYQILGRIFVATVQSRLIARSPCQGVRLPRIEQTEKRYLSPAEIHPHVARRRPRRTHRHLPQRRRPDLHRTGRRAATSQQPPNPLLETRSAILRRRAMPFP